MRKMRDLFDEWALPAAFVAVALGLLFVIWYAASAVEARAYNRITGSNVSAFDAMFVELRVQEGAKK
jgi:hypothetical protein